MAPEHEHGRVVHASAPVRTADVGGWTDTWFAGHGVVCNVALDQRVEVRVMNGAAPGEAVHLQVALTGESYELLRGRPVGRHPMLEGAVLRCWPGDGSVVHVGAGHEAGSGLGSSASVMVALVAALTVAGGRGAEDPVEVARIAHECEVAAGRQSGVQDHVAAAHGGVSRIEVDYPVARHTPVRIEPVVHAALSARLHTISFGREHSSSSIHDEVIAGLAAEAVPKALDSIRRAAASAADSLTRGDLAAYGAALVDSQEGMRSLHADIVSAEVDAVADLARRFGALGWKSNGAGGEGGSMVVLGPDDPERNHALVAALVDHGRHLVRAPLATDGVRVRRVGAGR